MTSYCHHTNNINTQQQQQQQQQQEILARHRQKKAEIEKAQSHLLEARHPSQPEEELVVDDEGLNPHDHPCHPRPNEKMAVAHAAPIHPDLPTQQQQGQLVVALTVPVERMALRGSQDPTTTTTPTCLPCPWHPLYGQYHNFYLQVPYVVTPNHRLQYPLTAPHHWAARRQGGAVVLTVGKIVAVPSFEKPSQGFEAANNGTLWKIHPVVMHRKN
jgi:hypothetical protein